MFKKDQLSMGDWFLYYLLMSIPIVNIIIWIMVLVDGQNNQTLRNMQKLSLVMGLITVVILILTWGTLLPEIEQILQEFMGSF